MTAEELRNRIVQRAGAGASARRIARELSVSRSTVRQVLLEIQAGRQGDEPPQHQRRPSKLDAWLPAISSLLARYYVCPAPTDLPDCGRWKNLTAIGIAINDTVEDGQSRSEVRYYILSRKLSAKKFGTAVCGHWSIENRLHWQLDVTFGEDQSRIRKGHADANFSILRRTALSLLKNNHTLKVGIKNKRLAAGWDDDYLAQVLLGA